MSTRASYVGWDGAGTHIGSITRSGTPVMSISPERDVVFYDVDGIEEFRCPLEKLVGALRALVSD